MSPATVNLDLRNLKLILNVAVDWGILPKLPKIQMLKEPKRLKRFVTAEHFAAMYTAAALMKVPEVKNATPADFWRAIISFVFTTGWRINEVLNLRRNDVDFDEGSIIARWDDSKGKRDERIHLPMHILSLLRPMWNSFTDRPLSWGQSRRRLYEPFFELQKLAGIELTCEESHEHTEACYFYGFHDFKRSFATYNAGNLSPAQLQRLMKHTAFTTTQGHIDYAEVMTERPDVFVPHVLKKKNG